MVTLLLVDDDESHRVTLGALLESEGYEVIEVPSLATARAALANNGAVWDVVVLDRQLGDGLGTELVPELRARWPRCPIVLLTGADRTEDCTLVDRVLTKGAPFERLAEMLALLLASRSLPG